MSREFNLEFLICASAAQVLQGQVISEELLYEIYIRLAAHFDHLETSETVH